MATTAYDVFGITHALIKRITAKTPKAFEMNFLGSGWCWFEDYQGHTYWLHVPSETLLESSRNSRKG